MDLTREEIELFRTWLKRFYKLDPDKADALCDMALRAVPDGWQAVPKEPTLEMAEAGTHTRWQRPLRSPDSSREIWASMLAAAPKVTP